MIIILADYYDLRYVLRIINFRTLDLDLADPCLGSNDLFDKLENEPE